MKFEYEETTEDLQTRIDIHEQFGARDIDAWMLELLDPQPGVKILDVGCGAGKQCFAFHRHLDGQAEITGGDVSEELLDQARERNAEMGDPIRFTELNFNRKFPLDDREFDLVTSCFAIYYADEAAFTVSEMHRVLRDGGRLFTTGPMPENKQLFYDIIKSATGKPIPPMPGSSRYGFEILDSIKDTFSTTEVHIFENPLRFEELQPFLDYTRASLSEDRKLWKELFQGKDEFDRVMTAIAEEASQRLGRDGQLVMTKVVGGFLAVK